MRICPVSVALSMKVDSQSCPIHIENASTQAPLAQVFRDFDAAWSLPSEHVVSLDAYVAVNPRTLSLSKYLDLATPFKETTYLLKSMSSPLPPMVIYTFLQRSFPPVGVVSAWKGEKNFFTRFCGKLLTVRSVIRTASGDSCGGGLGARLQVMHERSRICRNLRMHAKLVTFN